MAGPRTRQTLNINVTGNPQLQAAIANLGPNIKAGLKATLQKIGNHIVERSKETAPILTGDLRASITAHPIQEQGDKMLLTVSTDIPYAHEMHQYLIKTLVGRPHYQLGPISSQMDRIFSGNEGGVGGSYFTRVLQAHFQTYLILLQNSVQQSAAGAGFQIQGKLRI